MWYEDHVRVQESPKQKQQTYLVEEQINTEEEDLVVLPGNKPTSFWDNDRFDPNAPPAENGGATNGASNGSSTNGRHSPRREFVSSPGSKHIMGYTGCIPGMMFRYGKSYDRAADDSMAEFTNNQEKERETEYQRNKARNISQISFDDTDSVKPPPQAKYKDHGINSRYPPIVGYTGHISHMMDSACSLGHGYQSAAMNALGVNETEEDNFNQERRLTLDNAYVNEQRRVEHERNEFDSFDRQKEINYSIQREKELQLMRDREREHELSLEREKEEVLNRSIAHEREIQVAAEKEIVAKNEHEKAADASVEEFRKTIRTGRRMFPQN